MKDFKQFVLLGILTVAAGMLVYYFAVPQTGQDNGQNNEQNQQQPDVETRTVTLYYYNPDNDMDASGNIMCSRQGLVGVERQIPLTDTPIQDSVRLLIAGELTAGEKARGITTEFPLPGFALKGASQSGSALTLEFEDPENRTSGGACRSGILWSQIEATAREFDSVTEVRFMPEELFQP